MNEKQEKELNESTLESINSSNEQNKLSESINNKIKEEDKLSSSEKIKTAEDVLFMLEKKIKEYESDIEELKLRHRAEIDNIHKRYTKETEKIYKFSLEKFAGELLPVIDNLERAVETSSKYDNDKPSLVEGVVLTLKSLLTVVKKFGIEKIDDVSVPFDPSIHQAISMMESEEILPNYILKIVQRGYMINGRLLRPAMVIVSKNKS